MKWRFPINTIKEGDPITFWDYLFNNPNVDDNTYVTLYITLFVFTAGFLISELIKLMESNLKRKRIRSLLRNQLNLFRFQTSQKVDYLNRSVNSFRLDTNESILYNRYEITSAITIVEIGYQTIYDAFFFKNKGLFIGDLKSKSKAIDDIWTNVKEAIYFNEQALDDIKRIESVLNKENDSQINNLEECRKITDAFIVDAVENKEDPKSNLGLYVNSLQDILVEFKDLPNQDRADVIYNEYILKVLDLNKKYPGIVKNQKLSDFLIKAKTNYTKQHDLLVHMVDQYRRYVGNSGHTDPPIPVYIDQSFSCY